MLILRLQAALLRSFARLWVPWWSWPRRGGGRGTERRQELRRALWRLRRSFAAADDGGAVGELAGIFRGLAADSGRLRHTVVAWIDVVEILVQEVESATGPGRGARKKRYVRAALVQLLIRYSTRGGRSPSLFEPLVFEAVAETSIDAVVELVNQNSLWQSPAPTPSRPRRALARLGRAALRPFGFLRNVLARLIRYHVQARNRVPPILEARIDEALSSTSFGGLLTVGLELVAWVGRNRDQVVAMVDVVSFAVNEAETFLELRGRQKKLYARDLILVFLQEAGLLPPPGSWLTPLVEALLDTAIDAAIDAVVHVFNKRQLFQHRSAAIPATATVTPDRPSDDAAPLDIRGAGA